jgi:hypothetical protein
VNTFGFEHLSSRFAAAWMATAIALAHPSLGLAQPASNDTVEVAVQSPAPAPPPEGLPFAKNEIPGGPRLGVGAGIGTYAVSLGSVERAFGRIEDVYRSQGYSLPRTHLELDAMRLYRVTLRLGRNYNLACQVGRSKSQLTDLKMIGGLLTRRVVSSASGDAALAVGLGGGSFSFSFTRPYGVQVSPTFGDGSYDYLRSVTLEGSATYLAGAGGVTLRPATHVAFDGLVQYVRVADASTDTERAGRVSMNLSGVVLGASLTFFY